MVMTRTAARGKTGGRHRDALHGMLVGADRGNHQPLVVVDAEGCHALRAQRGLNALQIDAQAVELDEAAAAADHLVEPVGVRRATSPVCSVSTVLPSARSAGPCA